MIVERAGNMFEHRHDCYVNTINCCGAMGAGIALEFKNRFPNMFEAYQHECRERLIAPGDAWQYKLDPNNIVLLGLAVKYHWRNKIRVSWAKMAVRNMVNDVVSGRLPCKDIALPRIGSKNGGRGARFEQANDNWPDNSEFGYLEFETWFLAELCRCQDVNWTVYKV